MRPNKQSSPSLSVLHTSVQPRPQENPTDTTHGSSSSDYYSNESVVSSPLSSSPSSPISPSTSTSPSLFQNIRHYPTSTEKFSSRSRFHLVPINLRRRPSTIDTILRQEQSRRDEDAIERQGLDLLEPRPVDLDPIGIDTRMENHSLAQSLTQTRSRIPDPRSSSGGVDDRRNRLSADSSQLSSLGSAEGLRLSQPRFVMGGIFEVMEGRG